MYFRACGVSFESIQLGACGIAGVIFGTNLIVFSYF